jgi:hypothetical protein
MSVSSLLARHYPAAFLLINGLLYAYLTALFLIAPVEWFARLGVELQDPLGYTELRTMYVGLMASLALFSLLSAWRVDLRFAGLLLALLGYLGLAATRGALILGGAPYNGFTVTLWVAELLSVAGSAIGLWLLPKRH